MLLPLILFSCETSPEAHFSTDTIEPEVGQDVYFDNESKMLSNLNGILATG